MMPLPAGGRRRALPAPGGGGCLRSTALADGRRRLFAGLSRSCRLRTGSAGPLRWGRWPAALAVPLPLPAGGRRRALPAPGGGVSPFDHTHRRSSLSIRRAEQEPPLPDWVRRATVLGPLARRPRRSPAAACGWSSPSTASPRGGSVSVRPRTPTVVAGCSPGRAGAAASGLGPPGHCAGATDPPPSPFLCRRLRAVVAEHCQPREGGVSPFDHVRRLSSLSIRRAEHELPLPDWVRRATALGPLARRPRRSSAAACGRSSPSTASLRRGECLRLTTYTDCRHCLFAGLSRSCRFRTGPAGPLPSLSIRRTQARTQARCPY